MDVSPLGGAAQSALEGLKRAEEKTLRAAEAIAQGALAPEDIVSLSLAALDFKANAAVLTSANEQTKALLDIVA